MSAATIERPLMTAAEVGKILRRHKNIVLRMAAAEEIGCIRENSRSVKFTQGHVDEYLAKYEVPATKAKKPARNPRYSK